MARSRAAPYWLTAPALAVYAAFLVVPIASVALLSFHGFEFYGGIQPGLTLKNFRDVFSDSYYWEVFGRTFFVAVVVTAICAVLGTFEAIVLQRMGNPWKSVFLLVVLGPLLISVVVRTLGWALLFGSTGLVNKALLALRVVREPVAFMYSVTGVVIALTHVLVPFVVISVWASLQRLDPAVERAAVSLGATQPTVLRRIIVPLAMPGILSGSVIVFALAASAFATPAIIGGRRLKVIATAAYDEFLNTLNWPLGACLAVLLLVANVAFLYASNRMIERRWQAVFRESAA
ncbi:MAG TPA: ABC transporter permease [Casimicrobiaceae bacterium]|nr:ABC transporter permease [Casimicrobiaceae bacterium]